MQLHHPDRERLNNGQGLGFTVFQKVIDKKTLNLLVFSVGSFYGTVIPLIMAFMPDPVGTAVEGTIEPCTVTEEQVAQLQLTFGSNSNVSCSYTNVTIGQWIN